MKRFNISMFLFVAAAFFLALNSTARNKHTNQPTTVYMFGFAASFNDSLVYITDIQSVDSAKIEPKTKFLVNRAAYANQLQFFLNEQHRKSNATCVVFFDTKIDKLQKRHQKLLKRYKNGKETILQILPQKEFRFVPEINKVISE